MVLGWLLILQLFCSWGVSVGDQIYLRELTIHTSHEKKIFGYRDKPKVYLKCEGGGNDDEVMLKNVNKVDVLYSFEEEAVAATHVERNECRQCRIMEQDDFSEDDEFGRLDLCHEEFEISGKTKKYKSGEFTAVFECKGCLPASPPDTKIVYVETQARATATAGVISKDEQKPDRVWQSPWFIIMLIGMTLFGLIFGGVSYRYYLVVRERTEEERLKEFEAILGDPDVDFDEMVEQDQKAFNLNFWRHIQWHPKKWSKVATEENI